MRGLVFTRNAKGRALAQVDLERWLRLERTVFKCEKVDALMRGDEVPLLLRLNSAIEELDLRVSIRSDCTTGPPSLPMLQSVNPWDVFLTPPSLDSPHLHPWLDACFQAGKAVRLQVHAPLDSALDAGAFVERVSGAVVSVNIASHDPFIGLQGTTGVKQTADTVAKAVELAAAFSARGIEVNLVRWPFCVVPEDYRANVVNSAQFYLDHQQYRREAYEFACSLIARSPVRIRQIVLMKLGIHTSSNNPIDRILLPWIMEHPWVRARVWAAHKLTRHRRGASPREVAPESEAAADRAVMNHREGRREARGPVCGRCALRRICDGHTPELQHALPGLHVTAQEGDEAIGAFHFAANQHKHYDAMDKARLESGREGEELARRANALTIHTPPTREIDSFDYRVDGTWSWQLPGSLRWFSFAGGEKVSTPLGRFDPPFTLSVTVGGGVADYVGFSLGRACKLVCPMTAYTHRVVLHVEEDGRYVLLRDGRLVRPVEFVGAYYAPLRLGTGIEPRISIWNIDGTIGTQAVCLWQPAPIETPSREFDVSIVMVSTRYARRLQASLLAIAQQQGIGLDRIEVIVAFVPGLDATADVIESVHLRYPELTLSPTAFASEHANSKGLMLNECLSKARGRWVMVLDADIILPPTMLSAIAALPEDCRFCVPDGRKMLDKETTARVLLGEVTPAESWQELLAGAGEYRMREADGVPVGYCQCVRRECLEAVRYEELHHFEGADWKFGRDMRERFGMERRLSGMPVLHLDHGSSNWYGALRHY